MTVAGYEESCHRLAAELKEARAEMQHWQTIASQGIEIERELRIEIERLQAENDKLRLGIDLLRVEPKP